MNKPVEDPVTGSRISTVRLLIIPILVYCAWIVEAFLLAGARHLFADPDPAGLLGYTIIGCIVTGTLIPLLCIRRAFVEGAVNMFQMGFRSARRTVITCSLTAVLCGVAVALASPFGVGKGSFITAFLLFLPTGIAAVMICWVLVGTHIQAYVRGGGALLSISVGVVATSLLFAIMALPLGTGTPGPDPLFRPVCAGLACGLFFFAVRDVYATVILVTVSIVFTGAGSISPTYLTSPPPDLAVPAAAALATLLLVHWYLSRHYATILVPVQRKG